MIRRLAGPVFVLAGLNHFRVPRIYAAIVPKWLPAHREIVYASGVAEIVGGAALMHPRTRRFGGWWLTLTLLAIFPANVEMALHAERFPEVPGGRPALIARLPFQLAFIAWVRAAARP